jgi:hypothetical protein
MEAHQKSNFLSRELNKLNDDVAIQQYLQRHSSLQKVEETMIQNNIATKVDITANHNLPQMPLSNQNQDSSFEGKGLSGFIY